MSKLSKKIEDIFKKFFPFASKELISQKDRLISELDSFMENLKNEEADTEQRREARRIIKEKMGPFYDHFSDYQKDFIANLADKYTIELPDDNTIREFILRRVMDLKDETVIILAYGKSVLKKLGNNLGAEDNAVERGIEALKKTSFLPNNLEYTYDLAISNIYANKPLLLGFVIDYFKEQSLKYVHKKDTNEEKMKSLEKLVS